MGARRRTEVVPDVTDEPLVRELVGPQVDVLSRRRVRELEGEVDRPRQEADRDEVHHDRGHDLVSTPLHLQDPRDRGPDHPAEHRRDQDHDHEDRARQEPQLDLGPGGRDHRDEVLPLDPDVEHPALEADGHGERREDQRRGDREHVTDPVRGFHRVLQDRRVHRDRALSVRDDQERAGEQRDAEGGEQGQQLADETLEPGGSRSGGGHGLARDHRWPSTPPAPWTRRASPRRSPPAGRRVRTRR